MTDERSADAPGVPLSDPDTYVGGHPLARYDELRARCPLSWQPDAGGYWAVTGQGELTEISRDPVRFSSAKGFKLKDDSYARLGPDIDRAMRHTILQLDPPMHGQIRAILAPFFGPQAIREREPAVRAFACELLDGLRSGETIDVVRTLTAPYPIRVLCDLLDVPQEDRGRVFDWTNRLTGADDPEFNVDLAQAARAFREVFDYGRQLFARRRAAPGRDILSAFATARLDGELLGEEYTDSLFVLMVAAGNETTRNGLTGALYQLGRHPEQRQRLLDDPSLMRNAVEECLRLTSPVLQMRRTSVAATQVGGVQVESGQKLGLFYGAANRDPRVYGDPHALDVARANARTQVAFGFGPHTCLGAPLSRLEIRVFLEEFLRRFPAFTIDSEPVYLRSDFIASVKRLMVTPR